MQKRQPMHRSLSIRTMPSSRLNVAPTGHTRAHGGLSQWKQGRGSQYGAVSSESCILKIRRYSRSAGMKWFLVHASLHLPHPSQAARSMTIPHFFPGTPRRTDSPTRRGATPCGVDATTRSPSAVSARVAVVSLPGEALLAVSSVGRQPATIAPAAAPPATTNPDLRNSRRCIVMRVVSAHRVPWPGTCTGDRAQSRQPYVAQALTLRDAIGACFAPALAAGRSETQAGLGVTTDDSQRSGCEYHLLRS